MRKFLIIAAALMLVLAACAPGQSPEEVQAQIETAVALTIDAQNQIEEAVAMTVAAQQALVPPTSTPLPSATPGLPPTLTPIIPTITPFTVVPSSGGGGGGGGGVYVGEYSCDVIHVRPYDNTEFNQGQEFDIKWTILNNGTATWPAGYDLKYYSGPHMTTASLVELPEMAPGDQYSVIFDANAPDEHGFQVMTWVVQGKLCFPYTAIIVK
jgi:hypothetical protein